METFEICIQVLWTYGDTSAINNISSLHGLNELLYFYVLFASYICRSFLIAWVPFLCNSRLIHLLFRVIVICMKPHGEFCQYCCDRCDWIVIVLQYAEDEPLNKRSKFNISFNYYSRCFEKKKFGVTLQMAHAPEKGVA